MAPLLAMKPPPTSKPGTSKGKKGEAPAKPPKKSTAPSASTSAGSASTSVAQTAPKSKGGRPAKERKDFKEGLEGDVDHALYILTRAHRTARDRVSAAKRAANRTPEESEEHRLKQNERNNRNETKRRKRIREDPVAHKKYKEKHNRGERARRVQKIADGTYAPKRRRKTLNDMERLASSQSSLAVRKTLGVAQEKKPTQTEADPVLARSYYPGNSDPGNRVIAKDEVVDSEKTGVLFTSILSEVLHEWSETKKAFCKQGERGEYQKEVGVRFLEKLSAWNADLGKHISDHGIQVAIMVKRRLKKQGRAASHNDTSLGPRYILSPGPKVVRVNEETIAVGPCYGMSSRARGSVPVKLVPDHKNFWRAQHAVQQATSDVSLIMDFLPRPGEIPTYEGDLALLRLIERAAEGARGSLDFSFMEGLFKKRGE